MNVRKSYKSLINWGRKNLETKVFDASNMDGSVMEEFENFHIAVAGRRTRSHQSWMLQSKAVKEGMGFVVMGYLDGELHARVSPAKLYGLHRRYASFADRTPEKLLHFGSGWGALERKLREKEGGQIPAGFLFPDESIRDAEKYWLSLFENGALPAGDPVSYLPTSWQKYYHLGVIAAEVPDREAAVRAFSRSAELLPNVWALRALAVLSEDAGAAEAYYDRAFALGFPDVGFAQEYLKLLVTGKKHAKAYEVFKALPDAYKDDERVMISAVSASLALGDVSLCEKGFFDRTFVNVREGEVLISELWYYYTALKAAKERSVKVTAAFLDWIKQTNPLPKNLDFRMK